MRSNKEKKKPKAEWNKKKGAPTPSPFALGQAQRFSWSARYSLAGERTDIQGARRS
jgi:hypothetical protein